MKNWINWCLTFCWAFASLAAHAQNNSPAFVLPGDKTSVRDVVQGADGQLLAAIPFSPQSGLFRWTAGRQWQRVVLPPEVAGEPDALTRLPSGAVVCLWDKGDNTHILTAHRGTFSRVVARFTGFLHSPRLFGDTAGNVWITGLGGDIYRVSMQVGVKDPAEHVETLADSDYFPGYQKSNFGEDEGRTAGLFFHDPLFAVPDGHGAMWFWTDRLVGSGNFAALRGVLRWENGKLIHYGMLAGLPDQPLNWIAPHDRNHVWVAVDNADLYEVDTESLRGLPVPEPEPQAFRSVQKMFALGSDWYVIAGDSENPRSGTLAGVLWRLRSGKWQKLLDGIDSQSVSQDSAPRPVLQTAAGLWLGAYGSGAWLLPAGDGLPVHLDWRYGYLLPNTDYLFALRLGDGGVLGFRGNTTNCVPMQAHLEQLLAHPLSNTVRVLDTDHPLVQGPNGHLWNFVRPPGAAKGQAALNEWDGEQWLPHLLPAEANAASVNALAIDSGGRVWLMPYLGPERTPPVYLYDPAAGQWQNHADFQAALLAQMDRPNFALSDIAFSKDGRVAYRDGNWHLCFFDGQLWHTWTRSDLIPHDRLFAFEPPFFGRDGALMLNIYSDPNRPAADQKSWAWTLADGWHTVPYQAGPHDLIVGIGIAPLTAPPGCPTPDPNSLVKDNQGVFWLTSGHVVYKATADGSSPAFAPGQATPFSDGRPITGAMTDPEGNTFLLTQNGATSEYVLVMEQKNK